MKEDIILCYNQPKGYGKTYYELEKLRKENKELKEQLENASSNYTKYIQERDDKIKRVTDHCYQQIFNLQTGWFPQDMYTTTEVGAKHKVYNEILNLLEDKNDN